MLAGGRYLSSDDAVRVFAAGSPTNRLTIEVKWRNGQRSVIEAARPNSLCEIQEPASVEDSGSTKEARAARSGSTSAIAGQPTHFQDVSELLGHTHIEEPFDDLRRQPLLPKRLSQLGPGVAWLDLDGNGSEDLVVGSGRGGRLAVFLNNGKGGFTPVPSAADPTPTDLTGLVGCTVSNQPALLVGLSGYELSSNTFPAALRIGLGQGTAHRAEIVSALANPSRASVGPLAVADIDGDGREDVFLSQNFFGLPAEALRLDAGRGLWLRGDGRGGLEPVPGEVSGIKVYGEQRGCAAADYDGDGRLDLVVTQNGSATKLYHNLGAKPGLRVQLHGPPGNPAGIGALLRVVNGHHSGPVREVHAGSGYWSQDGGVQALSLPEPGARLWVRWPGGVERMYELPAGAREVVLAMGGQVLKSSP
jgi:hypothetical protein